MVSHTYFSAHARVTSSREKRRQRKKDFCFPLDDVDDDSFRLFQHLSRLGLPCKENETKCPYYRRDVGQSSLFSHSLV